MRFRKREISPLRDSVWGPEIAAIMRKPWPWEYRWVWRFVGVIPLSIIPSVAFAMALFRQGLELRLLYAWPLGIACGVTVSSVAVWMEAKGWIEIEGDSGD
jgi:hypothetical protein